MTVFTTAVVVVSVIVVLVLVLVLAVIVAKPTIMVTLKKVGVVVVDQATTILQLTVVAQEVVLA